MVKEKSWINRNQRSFLKDIVPLDMPLSMQIEPTGACNFRCNYCYHSLDSNKQRPAKSLSMDIFKKFIADATDFPRKLKSVTFCGGGEPLLNNNIYEMISLANQIANETVILTNGSLLNKDRISKIIDSNLGTLRVSLQGICKEDYLNNCNFDINFEQFLDNLEYLYKNKGNTKIVLKMPDIAIDTEEKIEKFHKLFEDKCDNLTVQVISNLVSELDYNKIQVHSNNSLYGEKLQSINVCPQIFFTMIMDQEGNIFPCSDAYYNFTSPKIGNIKNNTLKEIWNSEELKTLRINHLEGKRFCLNSCKDCDHINALNNKFDNLDDCREEILKKFLEA